MEQLLAKALGQDVSKLAAQEKQLLLSRLLARFAHEIRNPLSSLDIHVQLLEEDLAQAPATIREKTTDRLEIIHGEIHRLETIVRHFLSLAGPSALDLQTVAPGQLVRHVWTLLRPEADSRAIELILDAPDGLPSIRADAGQLTQALLNLVINAIQAVDRTGHVQLRARGSAAEGSMTIEVQDSGPGIPADKQSAIFEPFFSTKPEGTGLGLWIVQQIVIAHGGVVQVETPPAGGAIFRLVLPVPAEAVRP